MSGDKWYCNVAFIWEMNRKCWKLLLLYLEDMNPTTWRQNVIICCVSWLEIMLKRTAAKSRSNVTSGRCRQLLAVSECNMQRSDTESVAFMAPFRGFVLRLTLYKPTYYKLQLKYFVNINSGSPSSYKGAVNFFSDWMSYLFDRNDLYLTFIFSMLLPLI
jgi:hypothetical protein